MNHIISDLEDFMRRLYEVTAVRKELEKVKKAGKRKNECKLVDSQLRRKHDF